MALCEFIEDKSMAMLSASVHKCMSALIMSISSQLLMGAGPVRKSIWDIQLWMKLHEKCFITDRNKHWVEEYMISKFTVRISPSIHVYKAGKYELKISIKNLQVAKSYA